MENTSPTASATAASAHSAESNIAGLFHAQHTALLVRTHLAHTPHFPADADASAVARIQYARLTAPFSAPEHRKRRSYWIARRPPASGIGKAAARRNLPAGPYATPGESTDSAPCTARGTSVLSALLDYQAAADTSLSCVWHGASHFLSFCENVRGLIDWGVSTVVCAEV